jgi:subtilisin-like proprotein convertase family protein
MEQINCGNFQAIKFYLETKAGWAASTSTVVRPGDINVRVMTADEIRGHLAIALKSPS